MFDEPNRAARAAQYDALQNAGLLGLGQGQELARPEGPSAMTPAEDIMEVLHVAQLNLEQIDTLIALIQGNGTTTECPELNEPRPVRSLEWALKQAPSEIRSVLDQTSERMQSLRALLLG